MVSLVRRSGQSPDVLGSAEIWPDYPTDYFWSRNVTGTIDLEVVPGGHHSMFAPENASVMAEILTRLLAKHDPRRPLTR